MKKLVSALLVIALVLSMIPVTAMAAETTATLSFASTAQRVSQDSSSQVWAQNGITFTNNKGASTTPVADYSNPVRLYANSDVIIEYPGMTKIEIAVNASKYVSPLTGSTFSSGTVTSSGNTVTIVFAAPTDSLTITMKGQVRVNSLTVTAVESSGDTTCEHANVAENADGKAATCTETGLTNSVSCVDCGETVTYQQVIEALGHNVVDGVCTRCGEEQVLYDLVTDVTELTDGSQVVIVANEYDMALSTIQANNNRQQTAIEKVGTQVIMNDNVQVLTVGTGTVANTYSFHTGEGYLYAADTTGSQNYLRTKTDLDATGSFTVEITAEGVATVKAQGNVARNWLRYNQTSSIFSCYGSGQKDIAIYKLAGTGSEPVECAHPTSTVQDDAVAPTCTEVGYTATEKCDTCGAVTKFAEEIPALGHSYVDYACSVCMAIDPASPLTATRLFAAPENGDKIVVYHYSSKKIMSATFNSYGERLVGVDSTAADGVLPYGASAAVLTVVVNENGKYAFRFADGKYLASAEAGNALVLADELDDLSLWTVTALEGGAFNIVNKGATYNGTDYNQALECYSGNFTTYGLQDTTAFQIDLYLVEKFVCSHDWNEGVYTAPTYEADGYTTYTCTACGETKVETDEGSMLIAVAKIGETKYQTLAEAIAAANAMTGDVVVEICGKAEYNADCAKLGGTCDSINFVGTTENAEICITLNGSNGYISGTGSAPAVSFEKLTLSKAAGGYANDAGFMNCCFTTYRVASVSYTDCTFPNGAAASGCTTTYTDCTFGKSYDKYALWAYGNADITVENCVFDCDRGIKMYAEGAAKTTALTVTNSDFSALTGKPAIVLTYGESVALDGNTYSATGAFELDLDGAPNGTALTADAEELAKITCVNDNGTCGVVVDGKLYTTVAQAATVATEGSTVTLLHDSAETVELAEGVILDKNGYEAANVTVAVAPNGTVSCAYTKEVDGYVRVWGEGRCNAKESYVLKLYSGETLIATTALNNIGGIIDGDVNVTWNFFYPQSNDEYWTTTWEEGHPNSAAQPTRVELYCDGTKVAENVAKMCAPDDLSPVVWEELGGVTYVVTGLKGAGTEADPYLIRNVDELLWFQAKVDEQAADGSTQFAGKYFKLTADIDLTGINWNPIGSMSGDHGSFKGVFDGGDHTISNLNCQQAGQGLGLFARTAGNAEIKNLTLNNVTVKSTDNSHYVAAVVGNAYASTKITNVHVTGNIDISGRGYIGGIAGHGYVVMDNVSVIGEGTISSTFWCAGGILGYGGEGSTNITNAKVEGTGETGLTVRSAAGGLGAILGMAEDNDGTQPVSGANLSAKNVTLETYAGGYSVEAYGEYALGYLYGGNPTSNLTGELSVENVTFDLSTGNTSPEVADAVAKIGNAIYFSMADALAAAQDGDTVTLLRDVTAAEKLVVETTVTLNLNGYTLTLAANENYDLLVKGDLTIASEGTIKAAGTYGIGVTGKLTVSGGNFVAGETNDYLIGNWGTTVINGGSFSGVYNCVNNFAGTTVINGGDFETEEYDYTGEYESSDLFADEGLTVYGGTFSKPVDAAYCAEGYGPQQNADGTYGVHEHNYNGVYTEPTYEADGYTTYTCTVCGDSYVETDEGSKLQRVAPNATVTEQGAVTLNPGEYKIFNGSLVAGTEPCPLEVVVNFQAEDTLEECLAGGYAQWLVDFNITFTGMAGESITADNCYLAGIYGGFGWIVIPTDGVELDNGVTYPVVALYDASLNYKDICNSVKNFTAAIHIDQAILDANPNLEVKLELVMTNPENPAETMQIGEDLVYSFEALSAAVAKNTDTQKVYTTVQAAIDDAENGETVVLLNNAAESFVWVTKGVTLDLNGKTLTAEQFAVTGKVIDTTAAQGVLKVEAENFFLTSDHEYLPILTDAGYRFQLVTVKTQSYKIVEGNNNKLNFAFYLDCGIESLLAQEMKDGLANNNLQIAVKLTWTNADGVETNRTFVFSENTVMEYFEKWDSATFVLGVSGLENVQELKMEPVVISTVDNNTAVEVCGTTLTYTK